MPGFLSWLEGLRGNLRCLSANHLLSAHKISGIHQAWPVGRIALRLMRPKWADVMPVGINEDELVIRLETVNVSDLIPRLDTRSTPLLENERKAFSLSAVVDTESLIVSVRRCFHPCAA